MKNGRPENVTSHSNQVRTAKIYQTLLQNKWDGAEVFLTAEDGKFDSTQTGEDSTQKESVTPHIGEEDSAQTDFSPEILAIGELARESRKLPKARMRELILELCGHQFLTPRELGIVLDRQAVGLQQHYLRGMVQEGVLVLRYPDEPNHPQQAYGNNGGHPST